MPHLCISEQNRPTPVWRQLSLTNAGLQKLISSSVGLISLINVWSPEALSPHPMLYLYPTRYATLVPDKVGSFSSSNTAGTNGCLDLRYHSCPPSRDRASHLGGVLAPKHGELKIVWFFGGKA